MGLLLLGWCAVGCCFGVFWFGHDCWGVDWQVLDLGVWVCYWLWFLVSVCLCSSGRLQFGLGFVI